MTDEMDEEYNLNMSDDELLAFVHRMRQMTLGTVITERFRNLTASGLRQWYIENFILDTSNDLTIDTMDEHDVLQRFYVKDDWPSIEHAAIGTRLLFRINPTFIAKEPSLTEPDQWREEFGIIDTILHIVKPWEQVRYDPIGENWYQVVQPGQWVRHGKGNPSNGFMERHIQSWFNQISPDNTEAFANWPLDVSKFKMDDLAVRLGAVGAHYRAYRKKSTAHARIRQVLESHPIMHLDTTTLNQTRTIAPFANGALALINFEFIDTQYKKHKIKLGEMLPLNVDYMTSSANPMPWKDKEGRIPRTLDDHLYLSGDFVLLDELQDELLLNDCPTYWAFLTHAFPEPDERSAFLRLLGAAMFGSNIKIVAAMIGEPNAGKDTVMNWLNYLMPGQVATLPFSAFTPQGDEDRGFAPLRGARVATLSGEVGESRGNKLMAERIKAVSSGGGKLRVAEKYEKPTDIWFDGMLIMQGNSVPAISGGDRALYTNRIVAVEFQHPFPLSAKSFEQAYREEAPHFALVLFLNYMQYIHAGGGMHGIDPPESWRDFAKEFAEASNPHGFIEACIELSDTPIPTTIFHSALSQLAQRYGSPYPVGSYFWPKRFRAMGLPFKGPNSAKRQASIDGKRLWVYYLNIDASKSEGMFTQEQWERILKDAAVTV